jgi:taurine transport system permease protein
MIWSRIRWALVIKIASVCAFLGIWAAATELGWISSIFLPSPVLVARQAARLFGTGDLWLSIVASSQRVFTGFALAALIAVPLGILMGVWWPAKAIMDPFVSLLRPLPSITWIPLSILWLGIGESQKIAIVFMGSWIYVLLYTLESTKRVDPILIRAARNLGANDFVIMREVVLPAALPGIIAGLKVTLAISWSCVITAEMVAAQNGLGSIIWQAKDWGNLPLVLVGMVCISLTVLVADWIMEKLERLLLPWERNRRTQS